MVICSTVPVVYKKVNCVHAQWPFGKMLHPAIWFCFAARRLAKVARSSVHGLIYLARSGREITSKRMDAHGRAPDFMSWR